VIRKEGAIGEMSVKRMDDHCWLVIDMVDLVPRNEDERLTTGEMETAGTRRHGDGLLETVTEGATAWCNIRT
jgi:hypothetical protein